MPRCRSTRFWSSTLATNLRLSAKTKITSPLLCLLMCVFCSFWVNGPAVFHTTERESSVSLSYPSDHPTIARLCSVKLVSKEVTTEEYLRKEGFSDLMIDRFFRPFYQGIFLGDLKEQSSRMFEFLFRMFVSGPASLPSAGSDARQGTNKKSLTRVGRARAEDRERSD